MTERKGELFIIRAGAIRRDGWTGGDYTQYIASRDDGSLQPCRASMIPFWLTLAGFCLVAIVAMVFMNFGPDARVVIWTRVYIMGALGFFMLATGLALQLSPYRLMKAVQWRSYDGMRHPYYEPQPSREIARG